MTNQSLSPRTCSGHSSRWMGHLTKWSAATLVCLLSATALGQIPRPLPPVRAHPIRAWEANDHGVKMAESGDMQNALSAFGLAIQWAPHYSAALSNRGITWHRLGNTRAALRDLNRSIEIKPSAAAHFNRGNVWLDAQMPERAVADFTAAFKLDPQRQHLLQRSIAWHSLRRYELAKADFDAAQKMKR